MTGSTTSPLDNRRAKSTAANAAAEKARAGVAELEHRLQTNKNQIEQQTQALRHAEAEAKRLKRALKAADAERARLTKQRAKAVSRADKAQTRAKAAEAKYDQVVLAELVKREKARDRAEAANGAAAPASQPAEPTSARDAQASATPAPDSSAPDSPAPDSPTKRTPAKRASARVPAQRRAVPDPPPEQPDPGTAEAVKTAARRTRRAAR